MRIARDYQLECRSAIRSAFARGKKGVVVELFTGAGKGFIIADIAKGVMDKGGRVLVAVNRDNLCEQLRESLIEQGMMPILERGLDKASPMSDCVVGSVQTMQGDRLKKWQPNHFKLVITDEIHFGAANTFKSMLSHFAGCYHLGLSATIERHDKKGLWSGYEECVFSMPLQKGIEQGWLVPFEFEELPVPIEITESDCVLVNPKTGKKRSATDEQIESSVFEKNDYLPRLFAESAARCHGHKSLFFWPNCKSSDEAAKHFNAAGIESRHADGYMSKGKLAEILEWYRTPGEKALHNADLYSYGFDASFITLVGIMRLSRSIPMLKQRLGRGTRPLCRVDDYASAEERRAAIAASPKPVVKVLDLMIQLGAVKNKFADATALITDDDDEREYLRQQRKGGGSLTMDEIEGKLKMKRQVDEDKALAKLAEDAANAAMRAKYQHGLLGDSAPHVAHILRKVALPHWKAASEKAVTYLRHLGYQGEVPSAWHCHQLIDAYKAHKEKGKLVA